MIAFSGKIRQDDNFGKDFLITMDDSQTQCETAFSLSEQIV